jgi:hypothetical protein
MSLARFWKAPEKHSNAEHESMEFMYCRLAAIKPPAREREGRARIGQGRDTARQTLIDQPELCQRIEGELRKALGFGVERKEPEFELVPRKASAAG